ncbi:sensor histidine kinase [Frankia sp. Cas4]|uniref:sensor histidine kinase n=1 Tax=Frankia sp. Cas4 TaxID=3073927 RepID=UPI002AD34605|nr:histidine kinase [Frankia sp. Cas4]
MGAGRAGWRVLADADPGGVTGMRAAARRWFSRARDAALLAVVAAAGLASLASADVTPSAGQVRIDAAIGAQAAAVAVLALRRRAPAVVAVAAIGLSLLAGCLAAHLAAVSPVPAIAAASFFIMRGSGPWQTFSVAAGAGSAAVGLATLGTAASRPSAAASALVLLAAAISLALYIDQRHTLLEAERDRADRAEHERALTARQAVLEERIRIAADLHDVVGHYVALLVVQAGAATAAADDLTQVRGLLVSMAGTGRQAMSELRRLVGILHSDPAHQETDGRLHEPLAPAAAGLTDLPGLLDRVRAAGLPCELHVIGPPSEVPTVVGQAVNRIVMEGLTNVARHAGLVPTAVTITYTLDEVRVHILNHTASTRTEATGGGRGLAGMHARVDLLGGQLTAGPDAERATWSLHARIPTGLGRD